MLYLQIIRYLSFYEALIDNSFRGSLLPLRKRTHRYYRHTFRLPGNINRID